MIAISLPYGVRARMGAPARHLPTPPSPFHEQTRSRAEAAIAEPWTGITTDGHVLPNLFPLVRSGVSTAPIVAAARAVLDFVQPFALDDANWLRWNNTHPFILRHGTLLESLDDARRQRALELVAATLSADGMQTARDIMRLNYTIGEITEQWDEYGEWVYWLSLFGTPSEDQPWGWQIDGHHLNLNCLVLGDQVVITPMFMGSEPTVAPLGKYIGTRVFEAEEQVALELMHSLTADQRRQAIVSDTHVAPAGPSADGLMQGGAYRDNAVVPYLGLRCDALSPGQRSELLRLLEVYASRLRAGHDLAWMAEIAEHLDTTYVAWYGGIEADSTFYYRVQNPVILIEFDHLRGVALDNDVPARTHIHTIVRTPNGNDYGKDLLRQHYASADHAQYR